jgi:hypothetical protein
MRIGFVFIIINICISISHAQTSVPPKSLEKNLFPSALRMNIPAFSLPADYYSTRLGFFCKKEWSLEKRTGMAFRFRIGELAQLNKWEGKRY